MPYEEAIVLEELLRRKWQRELVHFRLDFPQGVCTDAVHLRHHRRTVPCQLGDVVSHRDHFSIASATLSFIADLEPLARNLYTYGCETVDDVPATDLEIDAGEDRITLRTGKISIAVPVGDGVPAGPVADVVLADGTRLGGSQWIGEAPCAFVTEVVARGPVFATVAMRWQYADDSRARLEIQLAAGAATATWDYQVERDAIDRGWELDASGAGPLVLHQVHREAQCNTWGAPEGGAIDVDLESQPTGLITNITPWADWWDDRTQTEWRLKDRADHFRLRVAARDPGDWVDPEIRGTHASWDKMRRKYIQLRKAEDGRLVMRLTNAHGNRRWLCGAAGPDVRHELNLVKEMILDWSAEFNRMHPMLYFTANDLQACQTMPDDSRVQAYLEHADEDLDTRWRYGQGPGRDTLQNRTDELAVAAWLLCPNEAVAERMHLVDRLRRRLDDLPESVDPMRYVANLVGMFDVVIDSGLVDEADRRVFRAQMAWYGYHLASPHTWSMERGYASRNPNMSISYALNLGMIGCVLPDHPRAAEWVDYASFIARKFLEEGAGPKGEWFESMNYTQVSINTVVLFAIAARSAGFCDLFEEPRLKKVLLYLAQLHSPPQRRGFEPPAPITHNETRWRGVRGLPPLGRAAVTGSSSGLYGVVARATKDSDPEFSATLQWLWREAGFNDTYVNNNFEMFRDVYPDRSLPATRPRWHSQLWNSAALFRHGLDSDREHYLLTEAGAEFTHPGEQAGIMLWYAYGVPVASRYSGGYDERAEPLVSRVSKAHGRDRDGGGRYADEGDCRQEAFAALPHQDYLRLATSTGAPTGRPHALPPGLPAWPDFDATATDDSNLFWTRQLLEVKDPDPAAVAYIVLRDTVAGDCPSEWRFWSLTTGITPAGDDNPELGDESRDATALSGDRFTGHGQFELDLEFFVASPSRTPRHTLRYCRDYGTAKKALRGFVESHDLLHLQLPGNGAYYVVAFPRRRDEQAPVCKRLGEGPILRVDHRDGRDWLFLHATPIGAEAGEVAFCGTAATVRQREDAIILTLGAGGTVTRGPLRLRSEGPASITVREEAITLHLPAYHPCQSVHVSAPGNWRMIPPPADDDHPHFESTEDGFQLRPFRHTAEIRFVREK